MARPLKDGVSYWPLDIDFFTCDEIRLIRTLHGAKGVLIAMALINECYKSSGYYKKWSEDAPLLLSDALACGITPELIAKVLLECIARGLFSAEVFSEHQVLTSGGIQRRYLRMLNNRQEIEIIRGYWLLDVDSRKDVPASCAEKLVFRPVKGSLNPQGTSLNTEKPPQNTQSKVNETKSDTKPEKIQRDARFTPPTVLEVSEYCRERGASIDPERFVDFYAAKGWLVGKSGMKDWKAAFRNWERSEKNERLNRPPTGQRAAGGTAKFSVETDTL